MQNTTYYNLNIVEGTDIVNPMSVDNPNYQTIDATMYANECNSVGSATELKSGTVHALTRVKSNQNVFRFRATARYVAGDTFTVDGNVVTAQLPDGSALADGAYIIGSDVLCSLVGTQLTVYVSINNAEQIMVDPNTSVKDFLDNLVVDNLTTDDSTKALSAKQGKVLNDKIDTKIGEVIGLTGNPAYFNGSSFQYLYYQKIGNTVVGGARIALTASKPAGQENYLFSDLPIPSGAIVPVVVSLGDTASLLINANGVLTSNDSVTGAHNISFCYICQ